MKFLFTAFALAGDTALHAGSPWAVLWAGPGILVASLMIAWGAEATQFFIAQGIALVIYAQMVLVRGVVAGLRGVDPALVDAARGLGLTPRQTLLRVEFPAALPVVLGGVRVATVSLVALATVAAWINAGGLGVLLFEGIGTNNPQKIVAGALAAALLAIAADAGLRGAERAVRR